MQTVRTIVIGMDWSPAALDAWRELSGVAATFGSQVVLVHAIPADLEGPEREEVRARAEELLRDMLSAPGRSGGPPPRLIVATGAADDLLLQTAREQQADLVVLGAGEKTTLDRVLLGRTAERVIREALAPVWVVRPGRAHTAIKNILCAMDDGQAAREALGAAVFLCRTFVAGLTVLNIQPDPEAPLLPGLPPRTQNAPQRADAYSTGERLLRERLARIDAHGVPVDLKVRLGRPAPAIVDAAGEVGCDLLVMGTRALSGVAALWQGSTAERVVRTVPSSILVVKAPRVI
jgi:nucleotide-binding universal stress UspA family protein